MIWLAILSTLLLSGCALFLPPEMTVVCKGKGSLSVQGGPYAGMIQGDCGDGFEYTRRSKTDASPQP